MNEWSTSLRVIDEGAAPPAILVDWHAWPCDAVVPTGRRGRGRTADL